MSNDRLISSGPFETLADARSGMAVGRVRGADSLVLACAEVGVNLGRFDARVIDEVGQLDGASVWVLASIIRRAGAHGL
ncbi:hypothetical protein C5B96_14085 [Subtercola sp. Z020]|uniref:hypothetical protein n=1 Tax=Subtercola sp. Z020 TaxID=2080582 RepID=UPI000CE83732|nr:hypothetical protein [Subtercola sp. Z020]PPF78858.1 hypothetical protein C5B96_14085 [Subtercola sp. Z020]